MKYGGKIENGVAIINKYKLVDFLQDKGYDYGSVMPKICRNVWMMFKRIHLINITK